MNEYLKDNLILGDWLENFFGSITLTHISGIKHKIVTELPHNRQTQSLIYQELKFIWHQSMILPLEVATAILNFTYVNLWIIWPRHKSKLLAWRANEVELT